VHYARQMRTTSVRVIHLWTTEIDFARGKRGKHPPRRSASKRSFGPCRGQLE
jgi:hypothetical protein